MNLVMLREEGRGETRLHLSRRHIRPDKLVGFRMSARFGLVGCGSAPDYRH